MNIVIHTPFLRAILPPSPELLKLGVLFSIARFGTSALIGFDETLIGSGFLIFNVLTVILLSTNVYSFR